MRRTRKVPVRLRYQLSSRDTKAPCEALEPPRVGPWRLPANAVVQIGFGVIPEPASRGRERDCLAYHALTLTREVTLDPDPADRGAFMAINASLQQLSGGVASAAAGLIVWQAEGGRLQRYDVLGFVVTAAMAAVVVLMYPIHRALALARAASAAPRASASS